MNVDELMASGLVIYKTIVGSQAYNLHTPKSDIDIKGFYWIDPEEFVSLNPPMSKNDGQISDEKNDTTFYSLYKSFNLLKVANPNFIELLWVPEDCIQYSNDKIMPILIANRDLFITKQVYNSYMGYANSQVIRARGKNKKVHNPAPKECPVKEDFCKVILFNELSPWWNSDPMEFKELIADNKFPGRPVPLKEFGGIDLSEYHVASLEHAHNVFRLYHYGENARGVFRGEDMLVCESIPKEDEWSKIVGFLIYDKNEFDKAVKDWKSYWDWKSNRNPHRFLSQEQGILDYDAKNLCHCLRLMMESKHILLHGCPVVRWKGQERDYLMSIRNGEMTYEQIMEDVNVLDVTLRKLFESSKLPEHSDSVKINTLYREIMDVGI